MPRGRFNSPIKSRSSHKKSPLKMKKKKNNSTRSSTDTARRRDPARTTALRLSTVTGTEPAAAATVDRVTSRVQITAIPSATGLVDPVVVTALVDQVATRRQTPTIHSPKDRPTVERSLIYRPRRSDLWLVYYIWVASQFFIYR